MPFTPEELERYRTLIHDPEYLEAATDALAQLLANHFEDYLNGYLLRNGYEEVDLDLMSLDEKFGAWSAIVKEDDPLFPQ